jgi:hypothetical protein
VNNVVIAPGMIWFDWPAKQERDRDTGGEYVPDRASEWYARVALVPGLEYNKTISDEYSVHGTNSLHSLGQRQ